MSETPFQSSSSKARFTDSCLAPKALNLRSEGSTSERSQACSRSILAFRFPAMSEDPTPCAIHDID